MADGRSVVWGVFAVACGVRPPIEPPATAPAADPCADVSCSGHGSCVADGGVAACACEPPYVALGLRCVTLARDPCANVACSGHGRCVGDADLLDCRCDPGYAPRGLACLPDGSEPCADIDCGGHGSCVRSADLARCACDEGYHAQALWCVADGPDPCRDVACSNHGNCRNDAGLAVCDCASGYEASGLSCVESRCHCLARTSVATATCVARPSCTTARDCCPTFLPAPFVCGEDAPFLYDCVAGACQTASCTSSTQCDATFDALLAPFGRYANDGCVAADHGCSGELATAQCQYSPTPTPCTTASDCCPRWLPPPYTCNVDYPYLYACRDRRCEAVGCTQNAHCRNYFRDVWGATPNVVDDGCVLAPTFCPGEPSWGNCGASQICTTAADCCPTPMPAPFVCNVDSPYLYDCSGGRCRSRSCTDDGQCATWFTAVYAPLGDFVNLGCRSDADDAPRTGATH